MNGYLLNLVWFLCRMSLVQVDEHHNTKADCFHYPLKSAAGFKTSWWPSSPAKIRHRGRNYLIGPRRRDSWGRTAIYGYISILLTCLRSTPGFLLKLRWYLNPARAEIEECLSVSHLRWHKKKTVHLTFRKLCDIHTLGEKLHRGYKL